MFLAGKSADVKIGALSLKFKSWRISMKGDVLDTTNFSSGGFRENIHGLTGATITLTGPWDSTGMAFTVGTVYSLLLHSAAAISLAVGGRLETLDQNAPVEGSVDLTLTFQSTGVFTAGIT